MEHAKRRVAQHALGPDEEHLEAAGTLRQAAAAAVGRYGMLDSTAETVCLALLFRPFLSLGVRPRLHPACDPYTVSDPLWACTMRLRARAVMCD